VAGALAEAHRRGIVHRDVTPSNILVDAQGRATLMDFGLARVEDLHTATRTSALGTVGYAAPELYSGVRAEPRSDLYSLGAVLYFAATGKAPFHASNPMGVLQRQLRQDVEPLATLRPELPTWLTSSVQALLHADPQQRPQGARVLEQALLAGESAAPAEEADAASVSPEASATSAFSAPQQASPTPASRPVQAAGSDQQMDSARADDVEAPFDFAKLGTALLEATTGRTPLADSEPIRRLRRRLKDDANSVEKVRPYLPRWLADTVDTLMSQEVGGPERPAGEAQRDRSTTHHGEPDGLDRHGRRMSRHAQREQARQERNARREGLSSLPVQPVLPAGSHAVLIHGRPSEPRQRLRSRRRLFRALRQASRDGYEPARLRIMRAQQQVRRAFGMSDTDPEQVLADAVAAELGLNSGSVEQVEELYRGQFRLVDGVSAATAHRLERAAQREGYRVEVLDTRDAAAMSSYTNANRIPRTVLLPIMMSMLALGVLVSVTQFASMALGMSFIRWLIVPAVISMIVGLSQTIRNGFQRLNPGDLPLAYHREMHRQLTAAGIQQLQSGSVQLPQEEEEVPVPLEQGAPLSTAAQQPAARDVKAANSSVTGPVGATPSANPVTVEKPLPPEEARIEALIRRSLDQLQALEGVVASRASLMADGMLAGLKETLGSLREQLDRLAREARLLQKELSSADNSVDEVAIQRIEARQERLQTLAQAGKAVDELELQELERALQAFREARAHMERVESRLTRVVAQLLELGAGATSARRELLRDAGPSQSAARLLGQLRQEVTAASAALLEVEALERASRGNSNLLEGEHSTANNSTAGEEVGGTLSRVGAKEQARVEGVAGVPAGVLAQQAAIRR
jgi:hypothetical protein